MTLKMMHRHCGHSQRVGESGGRTGSHEERPRKTGSLCVSYRGYVGEHGVGLAQEVAHQRQQAADVVTRSKLRHDAAVLRVQFHL